MAAVDRLPDSPGEPRVVQRMTTSRGAFLAPPEHAVTSEVIRGAARAGVTAPAVRLPYLEGIQRAFGRHDVGGLQAHVGARATASAAAMNARAYATGDHVVFAGAPTLRTVAHEAAHAVQQRGGARPTGGVGNIGDAYERHADEVADNVVAGRSAESLLDRFAGAAGASGSDGDAPVQRNVGFEFQCRYWKIMDYEDAQNPELYDPGKGAAPFMTGTGWEMVSDGGEPEFVVTHRAESDKQGLTTAMTSLTRAAAEFNKKIGVKFGIRNTIPGTHPGTRDKHLYIEPKQATQGLTGDPQVTAGIRFERLLDLFAEFTTNQDTKDVLINNDAAKNYKDDPKVLSESLAGVVDLILVYQHGRNFAARTYLEETVEPHNATSAGVKAQIRALRGKNPDPLLAGSDLEFADACLDGLAPNLHGEMSGYITQAQTSANAAWPLARQQKYAGFVALLVSYLRKAKKGMPYIKDFAFLSKSHLATAAAQAVPRGFEAAIFVDDVTTAAARSADDPVYPGDKDSPTIKDWLGGLLTGKDLLSIKDNEDFADPSMGLYKRTEAVGGDNAQAIILELRRVSNDMPYTDWAKWAESVRAWIARLNLAGAGAYTPYTK